VVLHQGGVACELRFKEPGAAFRLLPYLLPVYLLALLVLLQQSAVTGAVEDDASVSFLSRARWRRVLLFVLEDRVSPFGSW